jgi:hypothetical protein
VRNLTDADLTHATSVSYDCRLKGTIPNDPFWTSPVADQLWGDHADDAAWEGDALKRSIGRQLQRIWLFELADEYLGKMRLTTDERGREDLAKALSFGIRKAQFFLERRHQGDFSPDAERPEPRRSGNAATAETMPATPAPVTFQTLLDGWAAEKQPTQKTKYSWTRVVDQVEGFVGHKEATRLTADDLLRWKDK